MVTAVSFLCFSTPKHGDTVMSSDAIDYHTKQLSDDCTLIMQSPDNCFVSLIY